MSYGIKIRYLLFTISEKYGIWYIAEIVFCFQLGYFKMYSIWIGRIAII